MNERDEVAALDSSAVDPDFAKLIASKAAGPTLFMTAKLKLQGDLMLASRLTGFFHIPSAA